MLTKEQLIELQSLIQHPRFGNLLLKAIEGWKISNPKDGEYGLVLKTNKETLEIKLVPDPTIKCTCLLGSAMIGMIVENDNENPYLQCVRKLGFSDEVRVSLVCGFDDKIEFYHLGQNNFDQEAYDFAQQVRKIVLK